MSTSALATAIVVPIVAVVLGVAGTLFVLWSRRRLKRSRTMRAKESSSSSAPMTNVQQSVSLDTLLAQRPSDTLFQVPWNDWEITDDTSIQICRRKDGSEWLLGAGSSGRVYKATLGLQTVAVKVFTSQASSEAANAAQSDSEGFGREISILKACRDKNIVTFLGASLTVGRAILVTEYCENGDLYNAIANAVEGQYGWYRRRTQQGKPVPGSGLARRVALDTARGLSFLHDRSVVHRDLKSANILIARDLTAKIADVGMARIMSKGYLTSLREIGTFAWSAPEVLLGQPCSERVDIWSFGVILWELSTGSTPAGRHLRRIRVPAECPADVEQLRERCMDTDPSKRPSARELVEILSSLKLPFRDEVDAELPLLEVQLSAYSNTDPPPPA